MGESAGEPRRLGEGLDRVLRALGAPSAGVIRTVFSEWEAVVGAAIAAHARPLNLDAGRLVVAVDEPGWATQLRFLESDLLGRLDDVLGVGVVQKIEVRVRPG